MDSGKQQARRCAPHSGNGRARGNAHACGVGETGSTAAHQRRDAARLAPRSRRGNRSKRGKPCAAAQGSPPPVPLRGRRVSGGKASGNAATRMKSETFDNNGDIVVYYRCVDGGKAKARPNGIGPHDVCGPFRLRALALRREVRPLPSPSGGSAYREGMRLLLTTAECWDRLRVDPSFSYTLPTLLQASAFGAGLFCCPAAGLCAGRAARPGTQGQASAPGRAAAGEAGAGLSAAPLNRRLAKLQSKGLRWQFQGVPPR